MVVVLTQTGRGSAEQEEKEVGKKEKMRERGRQKWTRKQTKRDSKRRRDGTVKVQKGEVWAGANEQTDKQTDRE